MESRNEHEDKSMNKTESDQLHLTSKFTGQWTMRAISILSGAREPKSHTWRIFSELRPWSLVRLGHAGVPVTEDMVIAALLHDAVENQGGMPRPRGHRPELRPRVARMVEGLSDSLSDDPCYKKPWLERKQAYVKRLREEPPDVRLISIADKLYNARAILEDYREIGPLCGNDSNADELTRSGTSMNSWPYTSHPDRAGLWTSWSAWLTNSGRYWQRRIDKSCGKRRLVRRACSLLLAVVGESHLIRSKFKSMSRLMEAKPIWTMEES